MSKVLIYGDVSLNVVDGSSIWLTSIANVLTRVVDEVHVLLKFEPENEILAGPMRALPRVVLHSPAVGGAPLKDVVEQAAAIANAEQVDAVLVRGLEACLEHSTNQDISARLWAYVTDLPFPPSKLSVNGRNRLNRLGNRSRRMLSQTQSSRSYLEAIAPNAAGKTVIMSPMIPDDAFGSTSRHALSGRPLRLIYAGKFAKEWRTLEMLELPRLLGDLGVDATLTVVGSKFQKDPQDKRWHQRMSDALHAAAADPDSGVEWLGGLPRAESIAAMRRADIGIGWRTEKLDSSLEVSTKALEYGATGAAPLINETLDHHSMYTTQYPLFVRGRDTIEDVAARIVQALPHLSRARELAFEVSGSYSMQSATHRLRQAFGDAGIPLRDDNLDETDNLDKPVALEEAGPGAPQPPLQVRQATRVLVAAHDFKFLGEVLESFAGDPDIVVSLDTWDSLHRHNERESRRLLAEADVVFCEWAGPNLVWYSNNIEPDQQLVSRLHGFELRGGSWLDDVNFERVDRLVLVSDFYRALALDSLSISADRAEVITNMVDVHDFDRPKDSGAHLRLGMVGFVPFLKRPDRAIDLLETLRAANEDYFLHIRGRAPWEYPHHWNNELERQMYLDFYDRIAASDWLRDHVVFEPFGADMASWLRKIGVVLSPSDHESFHLAPAEGMASGAIPLVWPREGATAVFSPRYVITDLADAAERILALADSATRAREAAEAQAFARASWDAARIGTRWRDLIHEVHPRDTPPRMRPSDTVHAVTPSPDAAGPTAVDAAAGVNADIQGGQETR